MLDYKIIRILFSLGVPGVALGVFYLLLKKFEFKFSTINETWSGVFVIFFLMFTFAVVISALLFWRPQRNEDTKTNDMKKLPPSVGCLGQSQTESKGKNHYIISEIFSWVCYWVYVHSFANIFSFVGNMLGAVIFTYILLGHTNTTKTNYIILFLVFSIIYSLLSTIFAIIADKRAEIIDQIDKESRDFKEKSYAKQESSKELLIEDFKSLHDFVHHIRYGCVGEEPGSVLSKDQIKEKLFDIIDTISDKLSQKTGVEIRGTIKILVQIKKSQQILLFQCNKCRMDPSRHRFSEKINKDPLLKCIQNGTSSKKYLYIPDISNEAIQNHDWLKDCGESIITQIRNTCHSRGYESFIALPLHSGIHIKVSSSAMTSHFIGYVGFDAAEKNCFGDSFFEIDKTMLEYLGIVSDLISVVAYTYLYPSTPKTTNTQSFREGNLCTTSPG